MKTKLDRNRLLAIRQLGKQTVIVVLALGIVSIIVALFGFKPGEMFAGLWEGISKDIGGAVRWTTPLIMTGLAACITFRADISNLGIDGQLYIGALAATVIAMYLPTGVPAILGMLLIFTGAALAGICYALIPAFLHIRFRTDIVVITLLTNFIAELFTDYMILGPLRQKGSSGAIASATVKFSEQFWLPKIQWLPYSNANWGLYIAIIAAFVIMFVMRRTTTGYEIKVVGANPDMAQYGGIKRNRVVIKTMLISGLLAGVAGAIEVTGVMHQFPKHFNDGLGFDGIVVSVLGNNNPLAVLLSGFFFGALKNGAANLQRVTNIPRPMVQIIQGLIVLMVSAQIVFQRSGRWKRLKERLAGNRSKRPGQTGREEESTNG